MLNNPLFIEIGRDCIFLKKQDFFNVKFLAFIIWISPKKFKD